MYIATEVSTYITTSCSNLATALYHCTHITRLLQGKTFCAISVRSRGAEMLKPSTFKIVDISPPDFT